MRFWPLGLLINKIDKLFTPNLPVLQILQALWNAFKTASRKPMTVWFYEALW